MNTDRGRKSPPPSRKPKPRVIRWQVPGLFLPPSLRAPAGGAAISVFCRGEASGNGITGEPAHIMPDASPLHPGTQCDASVAPTKKGIASAAPRNDAPPWPSPNSANLERGLRSARRGRSVHGLTSPSPRIDQPLHKHGLRSACWSGVPRGRGEAEPLGSCLGEFSLAPTKYRIAAPPCNDR